MAHRLCGLCATVFVQWRPEPASSPHTSTKSSLFVRVELDRPVMADDQQSKDERVRLYDPEFDDEVQDKEEDEEEETEVHPFGGSEKDSGESQSNNKEPVMARSCVLFLTEEPFAGRQKVQLVF